IDPLRAANRIAGTKLFDWKIVSADGEAAQTTAGLPVAVEGCFDPAANADVVMVIGGFGTRLQAGSTLVAALRRAAGTTRAVGGLEAGTWLLGRAGLLNCRAAT